MKIHTKISYKKLLAISLFVLSYCEVKADFWSNSDEPKRNLALVVADITSLGTPSDVSGVYNDFVALAATDAIIVAKENVILADIAGLALADAVIIAKENVIIADVAGLAAADAVIIAKENVIIADIAALAVTDAAIITDIQNLGRPSDVSGLFELLTLIVFNLQLDPVLQVTNALNSPALQTLLTNTDPNIVAIADLAAYNTLLGTALTASLTATTPATETPANTQLALNSVMAAMNSFDVLAMQWNVDGYYTPTSPYSVARINNALAQLFSTLTYMLAQQPV